MPPISVSGYADLKTRVTKNSKVSSALFQSLFNSWLNEVITDVERTVPLQYCLQTREVSLSGGLNKIRLEGLIRAKEHNEKFAVGIKTSTREDICPIGKLKSLPIGADVRTYTTADYGVPECYFPISMDSADTPPRRVPGIILFPPPSAEATHVYIRGYFHPALPTWQNETTVWLIDNFPEVLIHGIAAKANRADNRPEAAQESEREYLVAMLGDSDTGKQGLLQIMRASEIEDPADLRMKLAPDVVTARYIGEPDWYGEDSGYYDPTFDYENQRYLPRG